MFDVLNNNSKVNPMAKELKIKGTNNDLIILVHGFTGCPREMIELGKFLNSNLHYNIYIPRLPGHGTNTNDFRNTDRKDWLRKIYELIINNENNYRNIHLIGLSMGALISMLSSIHFNIKSLLLISPALYAKNKYIYLTHFLKYFKPVLENDFKIDGNIKDPNLIDLYENYSCHDYTKQISELHKLMLSCRKNLRNIKTRTKILHSKVDELVPIKAANKIFEEIKSKDKKLVLFKNSPHVINYGPEKDKMFKEALSFFS